MKRYNPVPITPISPSFGKTRQPKPGAPTHINVCVNGPMVGETLPTRTLNTLTFAIRNECGFYNCSGYWFPVNPTETTSS